MFNKKYKSILFLCVIAFFTLQLCGAADCELYGLKLKKGESETIPGKCSQITCNGNGSDGTTIKACPNAYAPKHCTFVPVNLGKPYPECCPHWSC